MSVFSTTAPLLGASPAFSDNLASLRNYVTGMDPSLGTKVYVAVLWDACGHCMKFKPVWAAAARHAEMSGYNIKMFSVELGELERAEKGNISYFKPLQKGMYVPRIFMVDTSKCKTNPQLCGDQIERPSERGGKSPGVVLADYLESYTK